MRADRLLLILLRLQMHGRLTAQQLAAQLEVSVRTIYRDMDALSGIGVPIVADRGTGGGWYLLDGYQTDLTGLSATEVCALFLAQSVRLLADLALDQPAQVAQAKLIATLPEDTRDVVQRSLQYIHFDGAGWRYSPETVAALPVLRDAVWQQQRLVIDYRRADSTPVQRRVDPLGLVAKGSVWYLVGMVEADLRTYRVSRVQGVTILPETFTRPAHFDLAAYWAASTAAFTAALPCYLAVVRALPEVLPQMRKWRYAEIEVVAAPAADGWQRVAVRFETLAEATAYVLGAGAQIEVVEPAELRQQVICHARDIVALYGTYPADTGGEA